ncbi:MAG: RNA methyltransferase [Zetaproteobacteria bacterium]|nr:RNA methyltransferase [Zetaproteobacteria bacterium]
MMNDAKNYELNWGDAYPDDLWSVLSPRLKAARAARMEEVARQRTEHVHLIIQDVHSPHNIAACVRSAEALGVLHIHVVESGGKFENSAAASGVHKWLVVHRYESIAACAAWMRAHHIAIYAGMPSQTSIPLAQVPVEREHAVAVLFGNEKNGVSPDWQPHLAGCFTIPMTGMVESMNISVCAAISMYALTTKARDLLPAEAFFISPPRQQQLLAAWIGQHFPRWQDYYAAKS